ncbi:TPA: hypothetical protein N0F65_008405 [Lagenidium giganteum]|uniref:Uncharacterized protein n=1 Tax=Lagenidium giganteum TaxID=4803 RepID=A0AAV2YYH4_9STRA|nr:TPA: hypothetical protein N0F65_008405 [Lagenidium giganteum]
MTVEGVNHVFCVNGYGCSGNRDDGACPGKVDGLLPYGSYCGLVRTKVYGCKQYDNPDGRKNSWKINEIDCDVGMIPVSVAGAGTYCAKLPVCVGNAPGNCPSVPRSSTPVRCDVVQPNVYGCTALPPRL